MAEHLRGHFDELDHREAQIHRQRDLLEEQRRHIQDAANQLERQLNQRTTDLKQREEGFRRQMEECEQLINDLEEQQRILGRARTEFEEEKARLERDLETERSNLRQDIQTELAEDFQKLARAENELAEERRRFAEEVEQHRRDHQAALEEADQQLEFERAKLLEAVRAELESERQQIAEERQAWEQTRAEQEAALEQKQAQLAADIQQQQAALDQARSDWEAERLQKQADWESHCRKQAEEHAQTVAVWEANRDEEQSALKAAREADEAGPPTTAAGTLRPSGSNSSRIKPAANSGFRRNGRRGKIGLGSSGSIWKSSASSWKVFSASSRSSSSRLHRLNIAGPSSFACGRWQLDEHRERLAAREASLDRERETLERLKAKIAAERDADRSRLQEDRLRWEQERDALQAELERQSAGWPSWTKSSPPAKPAWRPRGRRSRTRIGNPWKLGWPSKKPGPCLPRPPVWKSRKKPSRKPGRPSSEKIAAQGQDIDKKRSELARELQQIEHQEAEFEADRQTLANWMTERDESLSRWGVELGRQAEELQSRETFWRSQRDQWTEEKFEAEHIIRDLLDQLEGSFRELPKDEAAAEAGPPRAEDSGEQAA